MVAHVKLCVEDTINCYQAHVHVHAVVSITIVCLNINYKHLKSASALYLAQNRELAPFLKQINNRFLLLMWLSN